MDTYAVNVQKQVVECGLRLLTLRFRWLPRASSFTVWGSSCRLWTNSFVAVSATVCLLHAVARALLDLVVGVDHQLTIGSAADLQPG